MFRGISAVSLDAKGRFAIPTKYRESLNKVENGQLILTIDTESPCLLLYPLSVWEVVEEKLEALPSFDPSARRIQRLLIGHATELDMDGTGRVLVPPMLRDYADLSKKGVLIGRGKNGFELWDEARWFEGRKRWLEEEAKTPDALPEEMKTLSL